MNTIDNLERYLNALDRWIKAQNENNPLVSIPTFKEFGLENMDLEMARNFANNRLHSVGLKAELK
jgi:hypothetical protein